MLGSGKTVHAGHPYIHQHNIGHGLLGKGDGILAISHLANHCAASDCLHHAVQSVTCQWFIVNNQDIHGCSGACAGTG